MAPAAKGASATAHSSTRVHSAEGRVSTGEPMEADGELLGFRVYSETHQRPGGLLMLLSLSGDLDLSGAEQLEHTSRDLLLARGGGSVDPAGAAVVVDAADLAFIDCAGLRALLTLRRLTTASRGSFSVIRARQQTLRLLQLTGTDHVITLHHNLAEAVNHSCSPPAG